MPNTTTNFDSIVEYPVVDYPVLEPTVLPQSNLMNEVGVQTNSQSLFELFINWFKEIFSLTTSEADSFLQNQERITDWAENVEQASNLDLTQTLVSANSSNVLPIDSISNQVSSVT